MAKRPKKDELAEQPEKRWESDPKNILHRLDQAILLAREHLYRYPTQEEIDNKSFIKKILYGYSDEDIQDIWNTIRGPLNTTNGRDYKDGHPSIDRLFDIAFDFNSAAQLTIEGEIDPTVICAIYALKTAEHAKTAGNQVSACLFCIDAWRALAFIPRAEYLGEEMTSRLKTKKSRASNIDKAQQKNKQNRAFNRRLLIIKREFDKLTDHLKYKKEPEEVAKLIISKVRNNKHTAKINIVHSSNLKDSDHDRITKKRKKVTEAIKRFRSEKTSRDLSRNISKQAISLDQSPHWPERKPFEDRTIEPENFSGEIREFKRGHQAKLDRWLENRAEFVRRQELVHKPLSEF